MATQTAGPSARRRAARVPRTPGELLAILAGSHAAALNRAQNVIATRTPRPHLALIAVPLGICAAVLSDALWIVFPLAATAWWFLDDESHWGWMGAVGRGVVAAEWAAMGGNALVAFPESRAVVAAAWMGSALLLAVFGHRSGSR